MIEMKRILGFASMASLLVISMVSLLVILILLISGCAGHPEGLKNPRELTDIEKDRVVEIALNTPEALRQLETENKYKTTEIDWLAIAWSNSQWSAYSHIDSEWETDPNLELVPESAAFYPVVSIRFGEPEQWIVQVAVDLDTEKVALVQQYPAKKGPQAVTLEDKEWVLESYGAQGNLQDVLEGTEITATFVSAEAQVHGTAGCNTYFGDYEAKKSELSISMLAWTERACVEPEGVMEQEQKYLSALQAAESYTIEGGELQIFCGDQVLVFTLNVYN
jgi:heat shock protein HslJ